ESHGVLPIHKKGQTPPEQSPTADREIGSGLFPECWFFLDAGPQGVVTRKCCPPSSLAQFAGVLLTSLVADMLDHRATGFRTLLARLCAFLHLLVVGGLFASGIADVAGLRTCLTDGDSQRTVAGGDLGCGRTKLRAVHTSLQSRQMFLPPGSDET